MVVFFPLAPHRHGTPRFRGRGFFGRFEDYVPPEIKSLQEVDRLTLPRTTPPRWSRLLVPSRQARPHRVPQLRWLRTDTYLHRRASYQKSSSVATQHHQFEGNRTSSNKRKGRYLERQEAPDNCVGLHTFGPLAAHGQGK